MLSLRRSLLWVTVLCFAALSFCPSAEAVALQFGELVLLINPNAFYTDFTNNCPKLECFEAGWANYCTSDPGVRLYGGCTGTPPGPYQHYWNQGGVIRLSVCWYTGVLTGGQNVLTCRQLYGVTGYKYTGPDKWSIPEDTTSDSLMQSPQAAFPPGIIWEVVDGAPNPPVYDPAFAAVEYDDSE